MGNRGKIITGIVAVLVIVVAIIGFRFYKTKNEENAVSLNTQSIDTQAENFVNEKLVNTNTVESEKNNSTENVTTSNTSASVNNTLVSGNEEKTNINKEESSSTKNVITNNTSTSINNTVVSKNEETTNNSNSNSDNEIFGKWNTDRVSELNTTKVYDNLVEFFGTSYIEFGSYLTLNEDHTFVDNIYPITDGLKATTGKYEILRNYNKIGDCYVELTYDDGRTIMLQSVYYDESKTTYLTFNLNDISYDLKK